MVKEKRVEELNQDLPEEKQTVDRKPIIQVNLAPKKTQAIKESNQQKQDGGEMAFYEEMFKQALREANFDLPLKPLGEIITPQCQPLIPLFDNLPWSEQKKDESTYYVKPAQHLLDGGLFQYSGDLKTLDNDEFVTQQLDDIRKLIFSEEYI